MFNFFFFLDSVTIKLSYRVFVRSNTFQVLRIVSGNEVGVMSELFWYFCYDYCCFGISSDRLHRRC